MAATPITVSPRVHVGQLDRLARARVERDGVAALAAATTDARQVAHLRRLARRLADDDGLDCYLAAQDDGATYLAVFARSGRATRRGIGWWGDPKLGFPLSG